MKKLIALLLTCLSLAAQSLPPPPPPPVPPNDEFFSYNDGANHLIHDSGLFYCDGYQWPWRNTGQQTRVFSNDGVELLPAEPAGAASANIFNAWYAIRHANNVKVALIDYGFDQANADLAGRFLPGVKIEFGVITENATLDNGSHGTQAASIIGAIGNNGIGIAGVCKDGAQMLPIQISGRNADDIALAIHYAVEHGVKIIYFSYGWPFVPDSWPSAFQAAKNAGVLMVCSAYNGTPPAHDYPAEWVNTYDNIILVGGHDMAGAHWPGSGWQYDGFIHFDAPSRRLPALWFGSTEPRYTSGTSSAAAFAVGGAALVWQHNQGFTYLQVKEALVSTAADGRMDVAAAVHWLPPVQITWQIPEGLHLIERTEDFFTWNTVEVLVGPVDYAMSFPRTGGTKQFFRYTAVE